MYLGNYLEDYNDLNFKFTSRNTSGVPTAMSGVALSVYKSNGTGQTQVGLTSTTNFNSKTGLNHVKIDLSSSAFYAIAEDYAVVIESGWVGSVNVAGETVGIFSIENRFERVDDYAGGLSNTLAADLQGISGDATAADNLESYTDGTTPMPVNVTQISGDTNSANNLESYTDGTTPMPVNVTQIEGSDPTNQIRDSVVDDSTRIDGSAINTFTSITNLSSLSIDSDGAVDSNTTKILGSIPPVSGLESAGNDYISNGWFDANIAAISGQLQTMYNLQTVLGEDFSINYDITNNMWLVRLANGVNHGGSSANIELAAELVGDKQITGTYDVNNWSGGDIGANTKQISGDSVAADNLELMYDGTGYTNPTAPSSRSQVDGIGASSGGSLNFEATEDNSSTPIKSVSSAGTETGTYVNTEREDGVYHQITAATNDIDWVYGFSVGGSRTAVEVTFKGYLDGSNDDAVIQAYDFVGSDWETIATINGQAGTDNVTISASLLSKHTGTGTDLGNVYIRIDGQNNDSSPTLYVDQLIVAAVNIGQSVGYVDGAVWIDTTASNTNTESFVDGTADNPVSTLAAARTIADNLNLPGFHPMPNSNITFDTFEDNYTFDGIGYQLNLGGQHIANTTIVGCTNLVGYGSGINPVIRNSLVNQITIGPCFIDNCAIGSGIRMNVAGDYLIKDTASNVAGFGTPDLYFVPSGNANFRNYSGGIRIHDMDSTCNMSLEGNGQLVIESSCLGGNVGLRGNFRVTDNTNGKVTILPTVPTITQVYQGGIDGGTDNTVTLGSTASSINGAYDPGIITITTGPGAGESRLIIEYDGTTKVAAVDKDWRTNPTSDSSCVISSTGGLGHVNEGLARGGNATSIILNSSASSTSGIYQGQTVFLISGTGQDQARIVTNYNATDKRVHVHRAWETIPVSGVTGYLMMPLPAIGDSITNIETDTGTDGVLISDEESVYHANIKFTRDQSNTQDEYRAIWFKNGVPLNSGDITSAHLRVVSDSGTELVATTEWPGIADLAAFKYTESSNRIPLGEAGIVIVSGLIDGSNRKFQEFVGRDST